MPSIGVDLVMSLLTYFKVLVLSNGILVESSICSVYRLFKLEDVVCWFLLAVEVLV